MLRTARALRPHVWTSVHSGMEALFMPYDHKGHIPGERAGARWRRRRLRRAAPQGEM